ncbi:MAG: anti-sigma factor antagonist [Bacillota bacterium]|jgi:stage II sporulation protein AA (anti-sigma F factor antagonist)
MSLKMQTERIEHTLIVRLQGELDHHTAEKVKSHLEEQIAMNTFTHMLINLNELTFMDSSGLGVLIGRYKQIMERGGQMVVSDVHPSIYRIFEMSGLFKIISVHPSESEALASLEVVS